MCSATPDSPQLRRYLGLVSNGVKPIDAATQAFGDLSKLVGEYNSYRNAPSIPACISARRTRPAVGDIKIETLSPAGQALVWDRLLYMRGPAQGEPASVAADLAKRAAAAPADPDTLDLLWRAQLASNALDAADKAADALLAVKPKDPQGPARQGLIAMKRLEDAKDYTAPKWVAARQFVIAANQGDSNSPAILFAYYQSFVRAQLPPTPTARLGLMRAFELQPQSTSIRLTLAGSLIGERRYTRRGSCSSPPLSRSTTPAPRPGRRRCSARSTSSRMAIPHR